MRSNQPRSPFSKSTNGSDSIRGRLFIVAIAVLLILSAVSCSSRKSASYRPGGVYHIVQPGQNLYRISLTYGVKLETVNVGARRYTTAEALERFIQRTTAAANGEPIPEISERRRRQIEQAEDELEKAGI